ncbi:MAG TPA: mechanosensitive ion channel family protein [Flavobacterium sp.]|nr:mechanosensitive ion channel family protein [Flavobacterium sp.]
MEILKEYLPKILISVIVLILYIILRVITAKLVRKSALIGNILEHRTNLIIKYFNMLYGTIVLIVLFAIWGVKAQNIMLVISPIFAVIGVAMFAQWSILSNVTAGIVMFFSAPFKIGDIIRIHDKDFPIEGEIEDIKSFYTHLKTNEGENITYPNNVLLQKGISVLKNNADKERKDDFTD